VPAPAAAAEGTSALWKEEPSPDQLSSDDKLWGLLANVLGIIFIIGPVIALAVKGSVRFVKFYAMQTLFLQLAAFAIYIVVWIVFWVLFHIPGIGPVFAVILWPIFSLVGLACLALVIIMGIKANTGIVCRLPVIGDMAHKSAYGN
jgi:uncharacterized membrane protein